MKMSSKAIKANMKAMKEGKSIVPVQENGLKIPVFSINSFSKVEDLSSNLGDDQPFYSFTPNGFGTQRSQNILEKAAFYLKEIKEVRPEGPYILSTSCAGHYIVFEMAQKLIDQGEEVPVIILFEAYRPIALSQDKSIDYHVRRVKYYRNKLRDLSFNDFVKLTRGKFQKKTKRMNFSPNRDKFKKSIDEASASKKNDQELIKNYNGNVVVFKSSVPLPAYNGHPGMGWREFVEGDLKIIDVEGDHLTILENPNAANLAAKLSEVLKEYN